MWIPSHIGIRENERADQAAREASNSVDKDDDIPTPQIKPTILKQIYPKGLSRREQVLLCRLRIGHTNVTHAHLLNRNPTPRCLRRNEVLTVEHILTYCTEY
nr:unnamed protein product [Callosobruchus chinensis]